MKVKEARKISNIIIITGLAIILMGYIYKPFVIIGSIVFIYGFIVNILYNRCSGCGKYFDRNTGDYCRYCGKKIDD